jgi:hypothetical protein
VRSDCVAICLRTRHTPDVAGRFGPTTQTSNWGRSQRQCRKEVTQSLWRSEHACKRLTFRRATVQWARNSVRTVASGPGTTTTPRRSWGDSGAGTSTSVPAGEATSRPCPRKKGRSWPIGIHSRNISRERREEKPHLSEWLKSVALSDGLRRSFQGGVIAWPEFRKRYTARGRTPRERPAASTAGSCSAWRGCG